VNLDSDYLCSPSFFSGSIFIGWAFVEEELYCLRILKKMQLRRRTTPAEMMRIISYRSPIHEVKFSSMA
jgi:hypothetical protein